MPGVPDQGFLAFSHSDNERRRWITPWISDITGSVLTDFVYESVGYSECGVQVFPGITTFFVFLTNRKCIWNGPQKFVYGRQLRFLLTVLPPDMKKPSRIQHPRGYDHAISTLSRMRISTYFFAWQHRFVVKLLSVVKFDALKPA